MLRSGNHKEARVSEKVRYKAFVLCILEEIFLGAEAEAGRYLRGKNREIRETVKESVFFFTSTLMCVFHHSPHHSCRQKIYVPIIPFPFIHIYHPSYCTYYLVGPPYDPSNEAIHTSHPSIYQNGLERWIEIILNLWDYG